jgi:GMP synthase (glutamine-hydrolysing)
MSHGDKLTRLPPGHRAVGRTTSTPYAATEGGDGRLWGLQFHPEVVHTPLGRPLLENFILGICGCRATWNMHSFVEHETVRIREEIGAGRVLCALSGGVDSAVTAAMVHRAVGERLTSVFVDNGLLRKGEAGEVVRIFRDHLHFNLKTVDASGRFLAALSGVSDPEEKRKIIGREFIEVFRSEAGKLGTFDFLAQGTLYPDVIESLSVRGPSATIKSHHNVGGLPETMPFTLVEPLRELFKDEVRRLGAELGLPAEMLWRQPFPGPGLAVRMVGPVDPESLDILREADAVVRTEITRAGLDRSLWQFFAVLLPVRTVGVMGDFRTYDRVCVVRAVDSTDGMTADWSRLPHELLAVISNRIINEVRGINRVAYDISSKPPGTIEWE